MHSEPIHGFAWNALSSWTRQILEEESKFLISIHTETPVFFSEEREFLMGWGAAKPALIFIWQQRLALSKAPSPKKAAMKSPKVLPPFSSSCPHFGVGFPNPCASSSGKKNPSQLPRKRREQGIGRFSTAKKSCGEAAGAGIGEGRSWRTDRALPSPGQLLNFPLPW